MGQRRRSVWMTAVLTVPAALLGLGLSAGSAAASTRPERADTLAQARDDPAIALKQVVRERLSSAQDKDWFRYVITRRGREVVTLGSLPANYNLAVYREDGSRIAVSDHRGKGFERIYFSADPGTYFVRVASTKGSARAPYRLWLRTLKGTLALQSFSVPKINNGYPFIVAEFANTTNAWLRVDFVAMKSVAADGRVLAQDGFSLQQWRVAPYGLLHVSAGSALKLSKAHDHYSLSARTTVIGPVSLAGLKRVSGPIVMKNGYRVHTGTVTNTGSTTRGGDQDNSGVSVDIAYYNPNGTILGTALGNVRQMAPGKTVKYNVVARQSGYWKSPFPKANRYTTRLLAAW